MVAKSFLGRSKSFEIISNDFELSSSPLSISDFVRENKATSAPEISAEQNNNTNNKTIPEMNGRSKLSNTSKTLGGSGSKTNNLN